MYEDLVRDLRNDADWAEKSPDFTVPTILLYEMRKAADVIEKLSNTGSAYGRGWTLGYDAGREESKPRWIPVTERLPDAYEDVMLKFPNNQAVGFVDRDGCWGVYSGDGFYTEVAENEPKPTHWAKKLPEPPKEET